MTEASKPADAIAVEQISAAKAAAPGTTESIGEAKLGGEGPHMGVEATNGNVSRTEGDVSSTGTPPKPCSYPTARLHPNPNPHPNLQSVPLKTPTRRRDASVSDFSRLGTAAREGGGAARRASAHARQARCAAHLARRQGAETRRRARGAAGACYVLGIHIFRICILRIYILRIYIPRINQDTYVLQLGRSLVIHVLRMQDKMSGEEANECASSPLST
eukprot:6202671-Pleurochrysis_carterae.AAC.2